jgi:two-component system chemotaxis sensor kinase CheA
LAGKPEAGTIVLSARRTSEALVLDFADDGRGIAWSEVRDKAREQGLPADSPEDLERALFAVGVSTASEVTDVSGRGVGLSALAAAAGPLGGRVTVHSAEGRGTRFVLTFPWRDNSHSIAPQRPPSSKALPAVKPNTILSRSA